MWSARSKQLGFTLLELLVVISVVGILVAIGVVSYGKAQRDTRDVRRKGDLKSIQSGFEQFYGKNIRYPENASEANTTLTGGFPTDPKNTADYIYTIKYDAVDGLTYCACGLLESSTGNAAALPSGAACSWGTGNYFCVGSLQ